MKGHTRPGWLMAAEPAKRPQRRRIWVVAVGLVGLFGACIGVPPAVPGARCYAAAGFVVVTRCEPDPRRSNTTKSGSHYASIGAIKQY
jgi:hypothetical protein